MTTIRWVMGDTFLKDVLNRKCKCGHQCYQHGNVFSAVGVERTLNVAQCVMCDCKEFEEENDTKEEL